MQLQFWRRSICLCIKLIIYYFTVVSLLVTYIGYGVTPTTNISTRRLKVVHDCFMLLLCGCLFVIVMLSSLSRLHDAITSQTDISTKDHLILFENHDLHDVVDDTELVSLFLHTSPSNPLYLFSLTHDVDTTALLPADSVLSSSVRKLHGIFSDMFA